MRTRKADEKRYPTRMVLLGVLRGQSMNSENHAALMLRNFLNNVSAHTRATVLRTEFAIRADGVTTKLDVIEGKLLFTCRFNSKKVTVAGGFSSISDQGGPAAPTIRQTMNEFQISRRDVLGRAALAASFTNNL